MTRILSTPIGAARALVLWSCGWRQDFDGWLVRARRSTDPDLAHRPDIGFAEEACIAVRTPADAWSVDRGILSTPIGHPSSNYTLGECLLLAAVLFGSLWICAGRV